jgi:hypothetical protein
MLCVLHFLPDDVPRSLAETSRGSTELERLFFVTCCVLLSVHIVDLHEIEW